MTQSHPQISLVSLAWLIGLLIVATALLLPIRRYLLPARPILAATAATVLLGLGYLLTSVAGVPTNPGALVLAPAAAMVATTDRPLAADAWLRGAATLAVVLTVVSVFSGVLMAMLAGAAASGVLCYLLGQRSAADSSTPGA